MLDVLFEFALTALPQPRTCTSNLASDANRPSVSLSALVRFRPGAQPGLTIAHTQPSSESIIRANEAAARLGLRRVRRVESAASGFIVAARPHRAAGARPSN